MQGKGAIKLVAILFFVACIYQLSFTFVTWRVEKQAKEIAQGDPQKEADYLRAKLSEKVFLGFTYKECKDKELSLGLDLKGGMNVTLEVSLPDIVRAMSGHSADSSFVKAMNLAAQKQRTSGSDFVTLFDESWNEIEPNGRLSRIFGTYELRERIKPESSNDDVLRVIRDDAESAVANSFNVLRNRIDRFGVAAPNIQRLGNSGRILVELPGVKEPERVRKLLQGTANLEFWETYENAEIFPILQQANDVIKSMLASEKPEVKVDSTLVADIPVAVTDSIDDGLESDSLLAQLTSNAADSLNALNNEAEIPLFVKLQPMVDQNGQLGMGPVIGRASVADTGLINKWLNMPQVRGLFPREFKPMWTIKAVDKNDSFYDLVAIKVNTRDGKAPLDGSVVTDARRSFGDGRSGIKVSMNMNAEGSKIWARLTADNIGKSIAIVLDDYVYSSPMVHTEITGGSSEISGGTTGFTVNEADDLANVLKSGKMPAPARIVQEAVVGPSLGQESINAGFLSFFLAFLLVLVYMWFYYGMGGLASNIALLSNVLMLFGALASFGAVLTMPGIAGIVLTMGMAVDANVIIYERIKEELRLGKSQRMSIAEGYKNAMSAIIDGQLTTLITGVVLYIFGSGPVQGFATTLVVGILTSLATSIFVSRLVFEWLLDKNKNISFGNKRTYDFLANTKVDFLGMRKKAYLISTIACIIGLAFIFTKGMSYGIDFTGGRTFVVRFDKPMEVDDVRNAIASFDESAVVKQFGPINQVKITTKYRINEEGEDVDREASEKLYEAIGGLFASPLTYDEFASTATNPNGIISSEKVGPSIADDMKRNAIIAVVFSLLAIFVYIALRFSRWEWGFGGVTSLTHDALLTVSIFSIGAGVFPWTMDIDQQFIAAILTIIGYSINDTVVIFDRIREYKQLYPKRDWYSTINEAINTTIVRTINTSLTVVIVLLAIFLFGGETIRGFSFALLVGVIIGAYSTVFIAIPVAYDLIVRKEKKKEKLNPTSLLKNRR
ncbi:MAG: protein translocase subunit SecDF [Prevotellaceae bacterium]|jgi:SecD/SecF fusion protein|nr:protein translocase subunit SecDF [Prevotellaceae bacterium]